MSFLTINTTSSGLVHVVTGLPDPPILAHALYELDGVWNCKNNSLAFVTNAFAFLYPVAVFSYYTTQLQKIKKALP